MAIVKDSREAQESKKAAMVKEGRLDLVAEPSSRVAMIKKNQGTWELNIDREQEL